MKNRYLLIFSLTFLPLFLFSQEKGIGLNMNLAPKYTLATKADGTKYSKVSGIYPRPILYGYKMYRHKTRMKELGLTGDYSKRTFQENFPVSYDTITKKYVTQPYDATYKNFQIGLNYTKFYRLASISEHKLNFWLGVRTNLVANFGTVRNVPNIGYEKNRNNIGFYLSIVPTVTYKVSNKLTLDARWNQPSAISTGLRYVSTKIAKYPQYVDKRYTPFLDLNLTAWQPNFQIGAKYALNTFEEPPIIPALPPKPTNTYYGIGLNIDIKDNTIYRYYKYSEIGYDYNKTRFKPVISVFRLSKGEQVYQEFAIGELEFATKNIKSGYYDKDKPVFFDAKQSERSYAFNYTYFHKIQKRWWRNVNVYFGANLKYYNSYVEAQPLTSAGYFRSIGLSGIRLATASSILWKINKKMYLETRFLPNLHYEIAKESLKDDTPNRKLDFSKVEKYFDIDGISSLQIGLKYILKTEKPTKIRNKPAIKNKK